MAARTATASTGDGPIASLAVGASDSTTLAGESKLIKDISIVWPDSNGNMTKDRLDDVVTWTGNETPPEVLLDDTDPGWNGGTLQQGEGILRFDFRSKSAKSGYVIRVNFTDGTFLDISQ